MSTPSKRKNTLDENNLSSKPHYLYSKIISATTSVGLVASGLTLGLLAIVAPPIAIGLFALGAFAAIGIAGYSLYVKL